MTESTQKIKTVEQSFYVKKQNYNDWFKLRLDVFNVNWIRYVLLKSQFIDLKWKRSGHLHKKIVIKDRWRDELLVVK